MDELQAALTRYREAHDGHDPAFLAISSDDLPRFKAYPRAPDGAIGRFENVPVYVSVFIMPGAVLAEPFPEITFTVDGAAWLFRTPDGEISGPFDSAFEASIESEYLIDEDA